MVHVHAWHTNIPIEEAATWSFETFNRTGVDLASTLPNKLEMFMTGVGWPTNSLVPGISTSPPSVKNLQLFIDAFVCTANIQGTKYFFFEYMNMPWKERQLPGVEGFWGLFNSNRTLKANIALPNCTHE